MAGCKICKLRTEQVFAASTDNVKPKTRRRQWGFALRGEILHRAIYINEVLCENRPGHKSAVIVNRLDFVLTMLVHSALRAVVGSMRVARNAGQSAATRAARKSNAAAVVRVTGSVGARS
jgi:hypothetical protein